MPSRKFQTLDGTQSFNMIKFENSGEQQQVSTNPISLFKHGTETLKHRTISGEKSMSTKLLLKYKPGEYTMPP